MKNLLLRLCVCLIVASLFLNITFVSLAESVDTGRESSVTLRYKHGDDLYSGLEIKSYRVAEVSPDGTYSLCGVFADLPVNIYGITSNDEWKTVAATIAAYVVADGLEPDCVAVTNDDGVVVFDGIFPGMYLTLAVTHKTENKITQFENFLTVVPAITDDGIDYNVEAIPKCSSYTPSHDDINFKVVKQWKESAANVNRPSEITIDILKDGATFSSKKLNSDNDWSYSWSAPDDGTVWQVVEREMPKDYTVAVSRNENVFTVTNIYNFGDDKAPQTGLISHDVWPSALLMALSGGTLIIIAAFCRRREE